MAKNKLPQLTESLLRALATPQSFARGREVYDAGAISNAAIQGNVLSAHCEGTMEPYYRVSATLDDAGVSAANCNCEYEYGGYCNHIVALLLTYIHKPKMFAARKGAEELLADLSGEDLRALVLKLLEREPELYDWVEAMTATPASKTKTARKKNVDAEVYRRQVRNVLHSLDGVRASEAYWGMGGMADGLRDVVASAQKFLDANDADTALTILLALAEELTNSHAYEYLDDSNGELGGFANEIGLPLAEAILSANLSQVEREQLVKKLTKWERSLSDYGMEEGLALAIKAAEEGWGDASARGGTKTARPVSARDEDDYDDDADDDEDEYDDEDELNEDDAYGDTGFYVHDHASDLTEAKLNVLARQNRTDEYLALCKKAGKHARYAGKLIELGRVLEGTNYALEHLELADEALTLARQLRELKKVPEALAVGERGLKLQGYKFALAQWLAPLEETQGRDAQALDTWLAAFDERPSLDMYKRLKELGANDWEPLQTRAMESLNKSWDKSALAHVLMHEEKWDEAIAVADQSAANYPIVAIVADGVFQHRPEWVIRASKKQALELIGRTQSKYYVHAVEWLERVKKAYTVLKQEDVWRAYLNDLKLEYKRRPALQAQLKRL